MKSKKGGYMNNSKIVSIDVSVIQEHFEEERKKRYSKDVLTNRNKKVKRGFYTKWVVRLYKQDKWGDRNEIGNMHFTYRPTDEQLAFFLLEFENDDEQVILTVEEEHWIEF